MEREVWELWGEALGVLAFKPSLSLWWEVKTRMPADLGFSEGEVGVVRLVADVEPKTWCCCCCCCWLWCWKADSVSIGELRAEASTDLEEEWAE